MTTTTSLTVRKSNFFNEKDIAMVEGESIAFQIEYIGASSVSSVTYKVYRRRSDITATVMTGSATVSGNIVTLPSLTPIDGDGKKYYGLAVTATVDGSTFVTKASIKVLRKEDGI